MSNAETLYTAAQQVLPGRGYGLVSGEPCHWASLLCGARGGALCL